MQHRNWGWYYEEATRQQTSDIGARIRAISGQNLNSVVKRTIMMAPESQTVYSWPFAFKQAIEGIS
jgi:hypothetical protein